MRSSVCFSKSKAENVTVIIKQCFSVTKLSYWNTSSVLRSLCPGWKLQFSKTFLKLYDITMNETLDNYTVDSRYLEVEGTR